MRKIVGSIVKIILYLSIITIVIFNIYNYVNLTILKKDISTVNGYTYLEVVSGSMEPTINVGDLILIDTKIKDYKNRDIITFIDSNGAFVTHRIINTKEYTVITQGDSNDTNDGEISKSKIIGVYKGRLKAIGYLIRTLKNPLILLIILIIGILICFITSTDKNGDVTDISDEMKEFLEYKESKRKKDRIKKINVLSEKKKSIKEEKSKLQEKIKKEKAKSKEKIKKIKNK